MSKHPCAMSANLNELPCSGGRALHVHTSHRFYHSLLMYHVHYVNHAPSHYQLCCPIHMCCARLSYPHKCFHVYHNLLFLKNITPLFFLPFSPPFAFLHFLYCNIYFYDNSKSNKNRTLPDWLGGHTILFIVGFAAHSNIQILR